MKTLKNASKGITLAIAALGLFLFTNTSAEARNGLPTIGGGAAPTCDTVIRGFNLSSGGTRAKDQIGLPPAGMIVFAELSFRPCGNGQRLEFHFFDEVTGQEFIPSVPVYIANLGIDLKITSYKTNLKLSSPYIVTATVYDSAGNLLQSQTLRIVTQNKI